MNTNLTWKKYHPLTDKNAFICLVDSMGDDSSIVRSARVSYGKDEKAKQEYETVACKICNGSGIRRGGPGNEEYECICIKYSKERLIPKDKQLIRYLMNHSHTSPFEMVEFVFMVQVPMDCWRQWVRHRTASINEYSTRYTEALDFFQVTDPSEWRLQATDNKQGSKDFIPATLTSEEKSRERVDGEYLSMQEDSLHTEIEEVYQSRLRFGVAREQARKDLPLSTYTRAYWKCDLHNIFNFLRLRMDSHAQLEIRQFANSMFEIIKQVCPVACEAFEDYVLHAKKFSRMEMEIIKAYIIKERGFMGNDKPDSMTNREWKEFLEKLS